MYYHDIGSLIKDFGIEYKKKNWTVFIESSKNSPEAVLLQVRNTFLFSPRKSCHNFTENEPYEGRFENCLHDHWSTEGIYKALCIICAIYKIMARTENVL